MVITVIIFGVKTIRSELLDLGFSFLYADKIGVLLKQPLKEAFAFCRADAIGVEGDNTHKFKFKVAILKGYPYYSGSSISM